MNLLYAICALTFRFRYGKSHSIGIFGEEDCRSRSSSRAAVQDLYKEGIVMKTKDTTHLPKKKGNMSLSQRLSLMLGILGFFIILILSYAIVDMGSQSTKKNLDKNMDDMLSLTGAKTSDILGEITTLSGNMKEAISFVWDQNDAIGGVPGNPWTIVAKDGDNLIPQTISPMSGTTFRSRIIDRAVPASRYNLEVVMMDTMYATIQSNPHVTGIGYFFEPNKVIDGVTDFAPYMTFQSVKSRNIINYPYSYYKDKGYYTTAKETLKPTISSAYTLDEDPSKTVITICDPIVDKNDFKGVITIELDLASFDVLKHADSRFPSLFTSVMDDSGNFMFVSNEALKGKNLSAAVDKDGVQKIQEKMKEGKSFHMEITNASGVKRRVYLAPTAFGNTTWWSLMSIASSDYQAVTNKLITTATLIGVLGTVLLIVCTYFLVKKNLDPLKKIAGVGDKVADGNLNVEVKYDKQDEIGHLADSFKKVTFRIKEIISDLNEKLASVAGGDFRVDLSDETKYPGDYKPLLLALRDITTDLSNTMTEIKNSAEEVNGGAEQVSSSAQALSQGATEQASSIQELGATMNDISAKIKSTADQSVEANQLSMDAGHAVETSNQKMREMSTAMQEITDKSNEISKIIKTIDDIAFQTNILSLNAAIEAARAGEAGKGFAVVADEVGNLAQKSAKAAQNTSNLIEETINAVERGAKISRETADSMEEVKVKTKSISDIIEKITKASEEEAEGIRQLTVGADQISSVVQTNSATAEESAAASEELSGQANIMNELVSKFRVIERED